MVIKTSDKDAEEAILGGIFVQPSVIDKIRGELTLQDFTDARCKAIYKAMLDIADRGELEAFSLMLVKDNLERSGTLELAGGDTYLMSFADAFATSAGIMYYVGKVKAARATQRLMELYAGVEDSLRAGTPIEEVLISFRDSLEKMTVGGFTGIDPFEPLTKQLTEKYERDANRDYDKPLGYELTRFKTLSRNVDGIQPGFYIVAGPTNTGKTSFLCNLCLDLLDTNPELTGIYFSMDDSRDVILNRLLSIKTGIPLNKVQRRQSTDRHDSMLREGYGYLSGLAKDERLFIRDMSEIHDIQTLEVEIKRRLKGPLFVIIDALYNLEVGLEGDQRKENIERANRLKALSNTYQIPVLTTGELLKGSTRQTIQQKDGKKTSVGKIPTIHDLMETGKFAYNANLVLMIYPEKWDDYDNEDEPIMRLKYEKNKLSHYRGYQELIFTRKTGELTEK